MKNLEGLQLEELDIRSKIETDGGEWLWDDVKDAVFIVIDAVDDATFDTIRPLS